MENTNWFARFNRSRAVTIVILVVVALGFWLMNFWTPTYVDDHWYGYVWLEHRTQSVDHMISSVNDLAISMWNHSLQVNSRIANEPITAGIMAFLGKGVFNFLNTAVFLVFVGLLFKFMFPQKESRGNANLLFLLGAIWFFFPCFARSCLWVCGSCNYLWSVTASLGFLALFLHFRERKNLGVFALVGMFLFSLFAAWMHEGTAIGIGFGLFLNLIWRWQEKKLTRFEIVATLGFWLGSCLVVFAPGTILRGLNTVDSNTGSPFSISRLILNTFRILWWSKTTAILLAVVVGMLIFCREKLFAVLKENLILTGSIIALVPFFILFGGDVREEGPLGLVIFSAILLFQILAGTRVLDWVKFAGIPFGAITLCHAAIFVFPEVRENKVDHDELFAKIGEISPDSSYLPFNNLKERVNVSDMWVLRNIADSFAFPCRFSERMFIYYGAKHAVPIITENVANYVENGDVPEDAQFLNDGWIDIPNSWFFVKKLAEGESVPANVVFNFEIDHSKATMLQENLLIPLLKKSGKLPDGRYSPITKEHICSIQNKNGEKFVLVLHLRTIEGSLRTPIKIKEIESVPAEQSVPAK